MKKSSLSKSKLLKEKLSKLKLSKSQTNNSNNNNNNENTNKCLEGITSLSLKSSTHQNEHEKIVHEVKNSWKRNLSYVCDQLGKDFPRYADKIIFGTNISKSTMSTIFSNDEDEQYRITHVLNNELRPKDIEVPDYKEFQQRSILEKQKYHMKVVFLIIAKIFEGENSVQYQYIHDCFDAEFEKIPDMGMSCSSFIEHAFINTMMNDDEIEGGLDFNEKIRGFNLLRGCTQGHFAPAVSAFQQKLGIDNITSHLRHLIIINVPSSLLSFSSSTNNVNDNNNSCSYNNNDNNNNNENIDHSFVKNIEIESNNDNNIGNDDNDNKIEIYNDGDDCDTKSESQNNNNKDDKKECELNPLYIKDNQRHYDHDDENDDNKKNEKGIELVHIKAETAHWGILQWYLSCITDLSALELLHIEFAIDSLIFSCSENEKEKIIEVLNEFISLELCIKLGLEVNLFASQIGDEDLPIVVNNIQSISNTHHSSIERIKLDHNHISIIPDLFLSITKSLTHLSLIKNAICDFPLVISSIPTLRVLSIGMNRIKEIPKEIGCLVELEELRCTNNEIVTIHPMIGELSKLRVLTLSTNCLRSLPFASLYKLNQLSTLTLFNNPIYSHLSTEPFTSAESISQFLQSYINTSFDDNHNNDNNNNNNEQSNACNLENNNIEL